MFYFFFRRKLATLILVTVSCFVIIVYLKPDLLMIFDNSGAGIGTTKLKNEITRTDDVNISKNGLKPTALLNFCNSQLGNQVCYFKIFF